MPGINPSALSADVIALPGNNWQGVLLSSDDVDFGTFTLIDPGTSASGLVSWGALTDGTGIIAGESVTLTNDQHMPFITGTTHAVMLPSGMLHYSLSGGSDNSVASIGTLEEFNLGIDIASLNYQLGYRLEFGSQTFAHSSLAGSMLKGSTSQGFALTHRGHDCAGSNSNCTMDVTGFLAGPRAEEAGVLYRLEAFEGDTIITGAAGLKRNP